MQAARYATGYIGDIRLEGNRFMPGDVCGEAC